jgi:hypothetical protein
MNSTFAWIIVVAIVATLIGLVCWLGFVLIRRWRSGTRSRRRVTIEMMAVVAAVVLIAWGAAIAP